MSSRPGVLQQGSHGEEVTKLQEMLQRLGYNVSADGQFGAETEAAVRDLQAHAHIAVDGDVGPNTLHAISTLRDAGYHNSDNGWREHIEHHPAPHHDNTPGGVSVEVSASASVGVAEDGNKSAEGEHEHLATEARSGDDAAASDHDESTHDTEESQHETEDSSDTTEHDAEPESEHDQNSEPEHEHNSEPEHEHTPEPEPEPEEPPPPEEEEAVAEADLAPDTYDSDDA
jgi:hypothetical protein